MLKVCLLVLGSVSLLPLAAHAMNEGDGWHAELTSKGPRKVINMRGNNPQVNRNRPLPTPPAKRQPAQDTDGEKEASSARQEKGKEKKSTNDKKVLKRTDGDLHLSSVMMAQLNKKSSGSLAEMLGQTKKPVKSSGLAGKLQQAQVNNEQEESFISSIGECRFNSSEVKGILDYGLETRL